MLYELIRVGRTALIPGGTRTVEVTALAEPGEDPAACARALDSFVRAELGLPSAEHEAAEQLLRPVDQLHQDLYQQQVAAHRDVVDVRLDRQRAERYRADALSLRPGSATDAITASEYLGWAESCEANAGRLEARLPERRAKVAELLEQIAGREAEPAVVGARALLGRQPPAAWRPAWGQG